MMAIEIKTAAAINTVGSGTAGVHVNPAWRFQIRLTTAMLATRAIGSVCAEFALVFSQRAVLFCAMSRFRNREVTKMGRPQSGPKHSNRECERDHAPRF